MKNKLNICNREILGIKVFGIVLICILLLVVIQISVRADIEPGDASAGTTDKTVADGKSLDAMDKEIKQEVDISEYLGLGKGKVFGENIKIFRNNGDKSTKIFFNTNGKIKINGITYTGLSEVSFKENGQEIKKNPQVSVDTNGKIVEAYFSVGNDGKYVFGNEEIELVKDSKVVFKDGKVRISVPPKGKINVPKSTDGKDGESNFYFSMQDSSAIKLENGDDFFGELGYKKGKWFFDKEIKIGKLEIKNPSNVETYILYDGNVHPEITSAYLSIDNKNGKITLGCNIDKRGPVVKFLEGNPFGVRIEKNDNFAMQALGNSQGSYISLQNREKEGKVPLVKTLNQWVMNYDNKGVYYHSVKQGIFLRPKSVIITDFGEKFEGSSSTPLEITSFKTAEGKEVSISKYNNILGIGNENNIGYGPNPKFIRTHVPDYYKTQMNAPGLYTGFSNNLIYNYELTEKGFEKFTGINLNDRYGMTKDPKNIRMLMDIFANIPTDNFNKWGIENFEVTSSWSWSGLADPEGTFYVDYRSGFNPGVIRHEMTHMHDFVSEDEGNFERDWYAIGGHKGPHTYRYGYTGAEDTSTLGEMINKDSWSDGSMSWKEILSDSYKYNAKFRGRIAVFVKYNFISRAEATRLYGLAGLPADASDQMIEKYIREAKEAYKKLG